jgi:TetR/AcrR family acrAB operon transcriptional repressor
MKRTKEEAEITRQTLLKAALVVFSKQGYAATRLEDIAAEAKVTRGAIYHHFGGKAQLYNALVSDFSSGIENLIGETIAEGGSTPEVLRRLLINTWEYLETNADYRAVMELTMFKTGVDAELEEGLRMKQEGTRSMVDGLAQMIHAGIERGELRADLDPQATAQTLISVQNGLALMWLLDPLAFSLKNTARTAAEIFVRGIQA